MAHLYLIRHGKPAFPDERKRCIGVTDVSLSEEGHEQMAGLKDFVRRADIKRIYVSPLLRSISSGQILSNGQIPIYVKENLSELHMGAWEGLTFDEIRQTWPADYARRREEYADFAIPGGETFSQCQLRAVAAYREILSEAENENIAIVGHAGFFRALISFLEGRDLNRLMDIPMPYAGVYEWDIGPNLGAVIVAAGLSSRMHTLKPVLEFGEGNFLTHELNQLFRAGVRRAVIVTGRDSQRVEEAAVGPGVSFVYNPNFSTTKMFYSVCFGLKALPDNLIGTFFLPADTPAFSLFTLRQLQQAFRRREYAVFRPAYKEKPGHPLLIRRKFFQYIFEYRGPCGLRGVLDEADTQVLDVSVPESGILLDADLPEEYENILAYEQSARMPTPAKCLEILKWHNLPDAVISHSVAVANKAVEMAETVNRAGGLLNIPLVHAAALLHDVAQGHPKHHKLGALWLCQMGLSDVAAAMENHSYLPGSAAGVLDEAAIVFLADKLFLGDKPCTVEQRYEHRLLEYAGDTEAEKAIGERVEQAKAMYSLYMEKTAEISARFR